MQAAARGGAASWLAPTRVVVYPAAMVEPGSPEESRRSERSGVGVVLNPHSRRNRRRPGRAAELQRIVGAAGEVRVSRDAEALARIADDFRRARVDVLGLCGGDGTTGHTLTAFARAYGDEPLPRVILLRGGTMNTIANGLGMPRRGSRALLRRLVRRREQGVALAGSRRVAMRVEGSTDLEPRLGFLFGTGLPRAFLEEYYGRGPAPTPVTAARTLARIAGSSLVGGATARRLARPIPLELEVGDERWPERPYLGLLAGTVEQVGLGFRPHFRAKDGLHAFHLVGIHGSPPEVVAGLWRVRLGRPLGPRCARDALVERAVVRSGSGRVPYFLDGDLHEAEGALRLEVGPAVSFVW